MREIRIIKISVWIYSQDCRQRLKTSKDRMQQACSVFSFLEETAREVEANLPLISGLRSELEDMRGYVWIQHQYSTRILQRCKSELNLFSNWGPRSSTFKA